MLAPARRRPLTRLYAFFIRCGVRTAGSAATCASICYSAPAEERYSSSSSDFEFID